MNYKEAIMSFTKCKENRIETILQIVMQEEIKNYITSQKYLKKARNKNGK